MKILILYATVSGNSAMLSEQLRDKIQAAHPDFELVYKDADECRGEDYAAYNFVLFVTSTWDEGDMNLVAEDYLNAGESLSGVKFALIGLGDSSYEHFCGGTEKVAAKLQELGAVLVGDIHKIDGFIEDSLVEGAFAWTESVINSLK